MNRRHRSIVSLAAKARIAVLAMASMLPLAARADESYTTDKPLELRGVMLVLGRHMQTVTDGISREDWDLVARTAPLIANHPTPSPEERVKIMTFVGKDVARFKGNDDAAHKAADALREAASRKDGAAVIEEFARLQSACLACHQQFRQPIITHFYGPRQK